MVRGVDFVCHPVSYDTGLLFWSRRAFRGRDASAFVSRVPELVQDNLVDADRRRSAVGRIRCCWLRRRTLDPFGQGEAAFRYAHDGLAQVLFPVVAFDDVERSSRCVLGGIVVAQDRFGRILAAEAVIDLFIEFLFYSFAVFIALFRFPDSFFRGYLTLFCIFFEGLRKISGSVAAFDVKSNLGGRAIEHYRLLYGVQYAF